MVIEYAENKEVKCYRDFVLKPDDRKIQRAFAKKYGTQLMEPAKKLHDRLKQFNSAGDYNRMFGAGENRIEIKKGDKENEPLILKARISRSMRKFFHQLMPQSSKQKYLRVQDWKGDFFSITEILVVAVNNHDYNKV